MQSIKKRARRETLPVWDNEVLGLDEARVGLRGSPTRVKRITRPRISRQGERFVIKTDEDVAAAAERIVAYLEAHDLL